MLRVLHHRRTYCGGCVSVCPVDALQLAQGSPVTLVTGNVPVVLSPPNLAADGLMAVSDSRLSAAPTSAFCAPSR